jgi:hypothetical protein
MPRIARALALAALALGCETIAGIEDRVYEPPAGSPECQSYCNEVMSACTGTLAVYVDQDSCLRTCEELPRGADTGATLECFLKEAKIAAKLEPEVHCASAGPFGGGLCGSACDSYCTLMAKACPDEFAFVPGCLEKCPALKDVGFAPLDQLDTGDTLGCRIHKLTLAFREPDAYCSDVAIVPSLDSVCVEDPESPPSCQDYCKLSLAACTGELAVYDDESQCLAVCGALEPGVIKHKTENTVACRKYHSYSAMADPATHCSHTGPGGDGHCGLDTTAPPTKGNCESYCTLLASACPTEFAALGADNCRAQCLALDKSKADSKYALPAEAENSLECRIYHVARTLAGDAQCAAAVGGAPCN